MYIQWPMSMILILIDLVNSIYILSVCFWERTLIQTHLYDWNEAIHFKVPPRRMWLCRMTDGSLGVSAAVQRRMWSLILTTAPPAHSDNAVRCGSYTQGTDMTRISISRHWTKPGGNLDWHFTPQWWQNPHLLKQLLLYLIGNHDMEWGINPSHCCWLRWRSFKKYSD